VLEEHRALLRARYDEAKALGARASASKAAITQLKGQLELWRAQRAAACERMGACCAVRLRCWQRCW
jgi:uncharacterized membrane protein YjdF